MFANSRKQGDFGVGQAIAYFTSLGWTVSIPLTDSQDYDLIVDNGSGLQRVFIRSATTDSVELRTLGGNRSWDGVVKHFDNSRYELLFVAHTNGTNYLFNAREITNRSSLSLNVRDKYIVESQPIGEGSAL